MAESSVALPLGGIPEEGVSEVERKLRQVTRALTALSRCTRAVVSAADETTLLRDVCLILTEQAGYRLAWAGVPVDDEYKSVRPLAWAGFEDGYLETARISWADCERGRGPTGRAIRSQQPVITHDAVTDPDFAPWREQALLRGFRSCISLPLLAQGQLVGVLNVYAAEVNAFSEDELHLLVEMADNLGFGFAAIRERFARNSLQQQLAQAQKMEAIGKLAGGIAHDFNNLLLVISSYAELLLDETGDNSRLRRHGEEIMKASRRAAGLTRQLLAFSRKQQMAPIVLDLSAVLHDISKMLGRVLGENIEMKMVIPAGLWRIKADPVHIEQVLMNLVVNSRDAMPEGGRLVLEAANVHLSDGDRSFDPPLAPGEYVCLIVRDTGRGIPPDVLPHIFEPFYSTKEHGTGLGLPTVYGIVQQSGGSLVVRSEVGRGTEFHVFLPRTHAGEAAPASADAVMPRPQGGETIMLVEDDDAVRESASEFLTQHGYTILLAKNGAEALDLITRFEGTIDIVVSDVIMPVMSGPEMARRLASLRPSLRVLFISGYTENMFAKYGLNTDALLQKPFTLTALVKRIRQVLDGAPERAPALTA